MVLLFLQLSLLAYYLMRQSEESIAAFKRALALNPNNAMDHAFLAFSYIESDQNPEEARAEFI